jgi:hypothetical protein
MVHNILHLHEGYPSVQSTTPAYVDAIHACGFADAYRQLLAELKAWYETTTAVQMPFEEALAHIERTTQRLLLAALEAGAAIPSNCHSVCTSVFTQVFGEAGQLFLAARQRHLEAAQQGFEATIHDYMATLGLSRYEAEVLYLEGVKANSQLTRRMDPLRQVEDALGQIEWEGNGEP